MKKISIDVRMLNSAGIGTYLKNIVPYLLEQSNLYNLIGDFNEIKSLGWNKYENVTIKQCKYGLYSVKEQLLLKRLIDKDTDLLWVPHFNIPANYNGKILVTIHDTFHLAMPEIIGGKLSRLYAKFLYSKAVKKSNRIITVSSFSKNEIEKFIKYKNSIVIIPNGVSKSWFNEIADYSNKNPYIIFVGNVKPHKNIKVLLKAFGLIIDQISHNLLIIGKKSGFINGDDKLINDHFERINNRVEFTGFVSDEDLRRYVAKADILVYPSKYEGFGLPPLEAMACNTPTIVSKVASLPEVCGDGSLYFDPNNAEELSNLILSLLRDESLKLELVKKGRENAAKYTWESSAKKHLEVIEELIK